MYTVEEDEKPHRLYKCCLEKLQSIGYQPMVSYIAFNTKLIRIHGEYFEEDKYIEISYKMFMTNSDEKICETIMHELAHNLDDLQNGKCSEDLDGHGETWQKIADDINSKLHFSLTRYSDATSCPVLDKDLRYHYIVKCDQCSNLQWFYIFYEFIYIFSLRMDFNNENIK